MLKSYIRIASRNLAKRKLYSFINAFGLSIGIAFCILIYLYIEDERSFDQFHERKNRIFRLHAVAFSREKFDEGSKTPYEQHAYLPAKLGEVMLDEMPEVEAMTRFNAGAEGVMRYQDKILKQNFACADSGFFKMFSFRVVEGSLYHVFKNPSDAVLTPEIARKYFGEENPIGKTFSLELDGVKNYQVVAVIESPPANSSLNFEMILPMTAQSWFVRNRESWGASSYPTFFMVRPGTDMQGFAQRLDGLTDKYLKDRKEKRRERESIPKEFDVLHYDFLELTKIHLYPQVSWDKVSDEKYAWILVSIALGILVIACINYISLALTTSTARRIEVGIRKVIGAEKKQLIFQFTLESLLLALISMAFGMGLAMLFLPAFNMFTGKAIAFSQVNFLNLGLTLTALVVVVGLLAGSYPALFLSRFMPARVLKGGFTSRLQAGFTRPLVVLQFALSAFLMISSVVMYKQMRYITQKDLGYDKEKVLAVEMFSGWSEAADKNVERFRHHVRQDKHIMAVAGTSASFNKGWSRYGYRVKDENKSAYVYRVDTEYIPLLGLSFVAGRNFDPQLASDSTAIIVNEALVKDMNWADPLNEYLNWREDTVGMGSKVIGVVKDYNFLSLERSVEPMFLSMDKNNIGYLTTMLIKLAPGDVQDNLGAVRKSWTTLFPDKPFEYSFVDEDVERQYERYTRWMNIAGLSTAFAIIIASLGLFGLSGINAVNKTKEIGIRKVMGAELSNIFFLLNRQYVWLALIAFILAAPFSWYVMNRWLEEFQFRITLSWELFVVSALGGLLLALITVSYHAIKAALINPAETLKYE